jgi:Protein of unknown function (DUF3224)
VIDNLRQREFNAYWGIPAIIDAKFDCLRLRRGGSTLKKLTSISLALTLGASVLIGMATPASAAGATQISGLGVPGGSVCHDYPTANYTIANSGDLAGCVYGFITEFTFHESSGTYHERADEIFVGSYAGRVGTFHMTENFSAKYDLATGAELFGRCEHPIVPGSGTGDLVGISGRVDYKDDVVSITFRYRGHIKL